jgi:hypothetical protein
MDSDRQNRRDFLKHAALVSALPAMAGAAAVAQDTTASAPFNGIQMGTHTLLDEGIDHALDLIQETAAINCVMVYSHTYHTDVRKPPEQQAPDHGAPPRKMAGRKLPPVWVKHHEQYFRNTTLRHARIDSSFEYADRDVFAELVAPTRQRGMKLYARILEGMLPGQGVANFSKVVTRDIYDRPTTVACWNHPEYKAWWTDTVEDMFRSYELDGLQWGAERMGPLMNVIMPWNNDPPTCFCEFCRARGKGKGIDPERARKGFEALWLYCQGLMKGQARPADGVFTGFLRILLRYPEILSWEFEYRQSREEMEQAIYRTVKGVKPGAQVGWHIDHQPSSFDMVYRAEMAYAEMAPYSDYLKPILYHDVLGPRIRNWYLARFQKTILAEVPLDESLDLYYELFGYDRNREPKLDQLNTTGFSPEYVYRETRRSVQSAEGKIRIYSGIGFDVPWNGKPAPADPETVYECVLRAFDAGASGIVVSRDYEEMRVPNLRAVGRAVREISRRGARG